MSTSGPVHARVANAPAVPAGLALVVGLTGFTDAGAAVGQLVEILREEVVAEPVVAFSNDVLLDYRARRPIIVFDQDHLTEYRPPRLEISLAHDTAGTPFLALTGYEPDFGWEAFVHAVVEIVDAYAVSSVTWVHAIGMPVPHTRPIGTTVSGTRAELIEAHSVWRPHTQIPATAGHLLELRLAARGARVASFALLVPHYLAETEYPAAALTALESISLATGLSLPAESLREQNREFLAKVDEQIAGNDELAQMVHGLEERYDQYMAGAPNRTAVLGEYEIPTADELAAELERFLASRPSSDDDRRGGLG